MATVDLPKVQMSASVQVKTPLQVEQERVEKLFANFAEKTKQEEHAVAGFLRKYLPWVLIVAVAALAYAFWN